MADNSNLDVAAMCVDEFESVLNRTLLVCTVAAQEHGENDDEKAVIQVYGSYAKVLTALEVTMFLLGEQMQRALGL